jgi:phage baseplate assembly protein gpV
LIEQQMTDVPAAVPLPSVVTGELIAITNEGRTPLVLFPGQLGSAAVRAGTVVDLHGPHIGQPVVLMFEGGDASRPIVMGVLREAEGWPLAEPPAQVEVDANGERMIVSAKEQLVLRCGKASVTLTRAGKVLIQGSYVSSRSTGVNRVKGGSVQLN